MHVFHITLASVIVLLQTHWENTYRAPINTKYVTKYATEGSQWNVVKSGMGKKLLVSLQYYKFQQFSTGLLQLNKTQNISGIFTERILTEVWNQWNVWPILLSCIHFCNKHFRNKSKWPLWNSTMLKKKSSIPHSSSNKFYSKFTRI